MSKRAPLFRPVASLTALFVLTAGPACGQIVESPAGHSNPTAGWHIYIHESDEGPPSEVSRWTEDDIARFVWRTGVTEPIPGARPGENGYRDPDDDRQAISEQEYVGTLVQMSNAQLQFFYHYRDLREQRTQLFRTNNSAEAFQNWILSLSDEDFQLWNRYTSERVFNQRLRDRLLQQRANGQGDNFVENPQGGDGSGGGSGEGSGSGEAEGLAAFSEAMLELLDQFDDFQISDVADSRITTNGWVSVQLEPIYRNYQLGQYGLTWMSLDLFPPGPSSVGNSLNMTINGMPSAVGWSLDLYPPALCGH